MKVHHGFSVQLDSLSVSHAKEMAELLFSSEDKDCRKIKIQVTFLDSLHKNYLFFVKSTDKQTGDPESLAFELKSFVSEDVRDKLHVALNEVAKQYCDIANAVVDKYGPCVAPISDRWFTQNIFGSCQEMAPYVIIELAQ